MPKGAWYQEAGTGMGQILKIAYEKKAYVLTDRATFLANRNNSDLQVLVEGDTKLLNIYHVMEIDPAKFDKANNKGAKEFSDFILSAAGQSIINEFGRDKFGQPLFFGDSGKTEEELGM